MTMPTTDPPVASGPPAATHTSIPPATSHASAAAVPDLPVEPDLTADEYAESAYDSEVASYTTSLSSGVTNYKTEHGRRYHAYKEGSYIFPNDEKENDRLDIAHKMIEVSMSGKLFFAPLKNPKRILDLGTGTGIWAMEIADHFPQADVLGNDLSPIQPRWVPPNLHFEIDDVEADWTYSQKFDFIHCRTMGNAIKDWPRLMKHCYEFTAPGGYFECVEMDVLWTSPDNSLLPDTPIWKVSTEFSKITTENGMEPSPGKYLETWLQDAGFEGVTARREPLPVGTWPADKRLKEVGAWNYLQITEGLEGFLTYIFTRSGYTKEEVDVLCALFRKQLKDPKVHPMFYLHIVYGRKPGEAQNDEDDA